MDISKTPSGPQLPNLNATEGTQTSQSASSAEELLGGRKVSHPKGKLLKNTFSAFKHFAQTIAAKLSSLLSPGGGAGAQSTAASPEPAVTAQSLSPTATPGTAYHEPQKDLMAALPDLKANVTASLHTHAVGENVSALPDKFDAVVLDANRAQFSFSGLANSALTDREALGKLNTEDRKLGLEKLIQECFGTERTDPTLKVALNLTNQNIFADIQVQQMVAGAYVNHAEMSIERTSYQLTQNQDGSYTLTATNRAEGFATAQVMEEGNMETRSCDPTTSQYALEVTVRIAPEASPGEGPKIELLGCTRTFHMDPVAEQGDLA